MMKTINLGLNNFFVAIGDQPGTEKIVIGCDIPGVHYTFMFKGDQRVVDLHKAIEDPKNGEKEYEPILKMPFFTFNRLVIRFYEANVKLIQKLWLANKINLGKLNRHNLILAPLAPEKSKMEFFVKKKRKKIIKFAEEIEIKHIDEMLLAPQNAFQTEEHLFWVYSTKSGRRRRQGLLIRQDLDRSLSNFYFVKTAAINEYRRLLGVELINTLNKFSFENEDAVLQ